jgi:hypothetical protein
MKNLYLSVIVFIVTCFFVNNLYALSCKESDPISIDDAMKGYDAIFYGKVIKNNYADKCKETISTLKLPSGFFDMTFEVMNSFKGTPQETFKISNYCTDGTADYYGSNHSVGSEIFILASYYDELGIFSSNDDCTIKNFYYDKQEGILKEKDVK